VGVEAGSVSHDRILVTGDRRWRHYVLIHNVLRQETRGNPDAVIIEGEAEGADILARKAAEALGLKVVRFPADWTRYGKGAGPIRNTQMLDEGHPTRFIAFHNDLTKSTGTLNMVQQCQQRGVPGFRVDLKGFRHTIIVQGGLL